MVQLQKVLAGHRVAVIDADDTLWFNAHYYAEFVDKVVELMAVEGMGDGHLLRQSLGSRIESAAPGERGFADSVLKFVREHGGRQSLVAQICSLAAVFVEHPVQLLPDAQFTIGKLPCQLRLLYTKGMEAEQWRKIEASGVRGYFDEVVITSRKGQWQLSEMLTERGIAGPEVLAIGNSIRHDIVPAVSLGAAAIWLNHPKNLYGKNGDLPSAAVEIHGWDEVLGALPNVLSRR